MNAHVDTRAPELSATGLAMATVNDPQFRLPTRPGVVPGAVVSWIDDTLVIEGTGTRRLLSGRSARRLLPDLLPLLDGTRTIDELGRAIEQSTARVRAVLLLLYSCGLLQEGQASADGQSDPQQLLLSRLLDTTRVNSNADQARARLSDARIGISGSAVFATALQFELGLQSTFIDHGRPEKEQFDGLDLAVLWVDRESIGHARGLGSRFREHGVPVLLVGYSGEQMFLGPYSADDYGACVDCYLTDIEPGCGSEEGAPPQEMIVALTAIEVISLLSRVGAPLSLRGRSLIDITGGHSALSYLAPRPGCRHCGDPQVALQAAPIAYQYETSVAFPPRRLVNPRDHQHHFESANVALQFDTKQYPAGSLVPLPGADLAALDLPPSGPPAVTMLALGAMLAGAFGLKDTGSPREHKPLRWAPTGGNLGSPTAYLVVRNVPGLSPGYYGYSPAGHALALLPARAPIGTDGGTAPVTIVISGALMRVAKKYRTFAYRIIHLDSGVALSHLLMIGARLGLQLRNQPYWDDTAWLEALALERDLESITALVDIGEQTSAGGAQ